MSPDHLEELYISGESMPPDHLKGLYIGGVSMSPDCVELMIATFLSPSSLETLMVTSTDLTSSRNCFPPLEDQSSNLKSLLFFSCQIGSQSTSLARALQTNHTIESLHIDSPTVPVSNQIGTEGAVALAQALESNKSLKELELLFDQSIGEAGARALANALQYNHTLTRLVLPRDYSRHFFSAELDSRVKLTFCKINFILFNYAQKKCIVSCCEI